MESNKYIRGFATAEITEKKSRFIASICPAKTEADAIGFIDSVRKKHYDARHNCYAYITHGGDCVKCSDDGEPSRTAGRPMLDVLEKNGIKDVCVTVTRYFGGVLLGTGGLVRAYTEAVKAVLDECELYELHPCLTIHAAADYSSYGKIERMAVSEGFTIKNTVYTDSVEFDLFLPPEKKDECIGALANLTDGRCSTSIGGIVMM